MIIGAVIIGLVMFVLGMLIGCTLGIPIGRKDQIEQNIKEREYYIWLLEQNELIERGGNDGDSASRMPESSGKKVADGQYPVRGRGLRQK